MTASPSRSKMVDLNPLRIAAGFALVGELCAIVWLASQAQTQHSSIQAFLMVNDKTAHALAFFVAGLTAPLAIGAFRPSVLCLSIAAAGIELYQIALPDRAASAYDFAASLLGACAGVLISSQILQRLSRSSRSENTSSD